MKKCKRCLIEKSSDDYHHCRLYEDKKDIVCKECRNLYNRQRKKIVEGNSGYLRLRGMRPQSYCDMWEMLKLMGYSPDANISIHEQFCLKYGLTPSTKKLTKIGYLNYSECNKKSHSESEQDL